MSDIWNVFVRLFTSLRLTVVLLVLSIVLVFAATLDQVNLGVWAVQAKYFQTFWVLWLIPGTEIAIPVFPGGYLVGGLLLLNLLAAHCYRFSFSWKKLGLILAHAGIVLLLLGELLSGLFQREFQMQLLEGETKNYSESARLTELAITETTNPEWDDVVAIPESLLRHKGRAIQDPKLPFRVLVRDYYPNSAVQMRGDAPNLPPSLANAGVGPRIAVFPIPFTYKQDEMNIPSVYVELAGPEGSLGIFLVTPHLEAVQTVQTGGRSFSLSMRFAREYQPFSLTLLKLRHDIYPGSEIPRNFSSRVRLQSQDGKEDREVVIFMNNPLRYGGLTFYQYQMDEASHRSVLQVVRNPSWMLPYVSCLLLSVGLCLHFVVTLAAFLRDRGSRTPSVSTLNRRTAQ